MDIKVPGTGCASGRNAIALIEQMAKAAAFPVAAGSRNGSPPENP